MAFATKQKRPVKHNKRVGQHHRHSNHYLKHYWPYLPLVFIVGIGLLLNSFWPSQLGVLGDKSDLSATTLLDNTNDLRQVNGQKALVIDQKLSQAAQAKAEDMVKRDYWSHNSPDGDTPWKFVTAAGYSYQQAGENLAYGFSDGSAVVNAWMHSQSHRENLLSSAYSQVGFGVAASSDYLGKGPETIVVAMYATPFVSPAPAITANQSRPVAGVKGASVATLSVPRITLIGSAQNSLLPMAMAAITTLAIAIFVIRHSRFLHKSLVRGEAFVTTHPLLDIVLVTTATLGVVLSQTAGFVL